MKKARKGLTLVEVLVSIALFSIILLSFTSINISMLTVTSRQEEYIRLEMVCYDINYYWDVYQGDWDDYYFDRQSDGIKGYLDAHFKPCSSLNAHYVIDFTENLSEKTLTINSIKSTKENRTYVTDVKCLLVEE